jgi:hypothetical protein
VKAKTIIARLTDFLGKDEMARADEHWQDHVRQHEGYTDLALRQLEKGKKIKISHVEALESLIRGWMSDDVSFWRDLLVFHKKSGVSERHRVEEDYSYAQATDKDRVLKNAQDSARHMGDKFDRLKALKVVGDQVEFFEETWFAIGGGKRVCDTEFKTEHAILWEQIQINNHVDVVHAFGVKMKFMREYRPMMDKEHCSIREADMALHPEKYKKD